MNHGLHLQYIGTCKSNNRIWFLNGAFNGLFSFDLEKYLLKFHGKIMNSSEDAQWINPGSVNYAYENKIFFFPVKNRNILVYDIKKNFMKEVALPADYDAEPYFTAGVIEWDGKILLIPFKLSQGIYVLDPMTEKVERDEELCKLIGNEGNIYNYNNVIQISKTEFVFLLNKCFVIKIDMKQKKKTYCKKFDNMDIWGIRYDGGHYWLLLNSSTDIYEWISTEDKIIRYFLPDPDWISVTGVPYYNMIFSKKHMIVLPCCLKYIMEIDKEMHTIKKAFDYPKNFRFLRNQYWDSNAWPAFAAYDIIDDHKVLIHPILGNMLLIYDSEKNSAEGRELVATCDQVPYLDKIIDNGFCKKHGVFYEIDDLGVEKLEYIMYKFSVKSDKKKNELIGKQIHDMIRKKEGCKI